MTDSDVTLPSAIRNFVFDLHDAVRRSRRVAEVHVLYESKLKAVTDKYFAQSPWPEANCVSAEVQGDELFLLFYRELAMRHINTKLKPKLVNHISSWDNYVKLFDSILCSTDADFAIPTQWIYDITSEFAYQFQGFCQFRCQVANNNSDDLKVLEANRDAWNLPTVVSILKRLIRAGKQQSGTGNLVLNSSNIIAQFGYFASIELARLECLLGDFPASLAAISAIKLNDRSELFVQLPLCHFNVYYHTGVCHMMLRKFNSALEVFTNITLHISRILKPGSAASQRAGGQMQRMLDKVLALTAIVSTLCPSSRLDDQVKDMIEAKWSEKSRRLLVGDKSSFSEMFEASSPKFISPLVPDYSVPLNMNQDTSNHILQVFLQEVDQHLSFLKLRSFLTLYASIELSKLARFNDTPEADLICQLLSYKNKSIQYSTPSSAAHAAAGNNSSCIRSNSSNVHFYVDNGALIVDSTATTADQSKTQERFFIAGVRKHAEVMNQVTDVFQAVGLQ